MILFAENITNRLEFVCEFVGKEICNKPIRPTSDKAEYLSSDEPKLNYSNSSLGQEEFRITPHTLLFENDIGEQQVNCSAVNGNKAFFLTNGGHFPFDVFAAI